jgi:hypothetical protein
LAQIREQNAPLRDALHQVLLREAKNDRQAEVLAAAGRSGDRLVTFLETLIGTAGVRALLHRSLVLTGREHPWLASVLATNGTSMLWTDLSAAEEQEPEVVTRAALDLLATFVNLLAGFIGERLTAQVLRQIWPELAPMLPMKKESP